MKIFRFIITIWLFLCVSSCDIFSGNSQEERELFEKIQPGMNKEAVIEILGEPDAITPSSSDNDYYYYYFTKNKSGMRSTMPYVLFDSTGLVKFSTYGEGG